MEIKKLEFLIRLGLGIWSAALFGGLGFSTTLVFQAGDTLKFFKEDSIVDQWIMGQETRTEPEEYIITKKTKVSADSNYFFVYEEEYYPVKDSISTKISFYNANKKKFFQRSYKSERKISFDLTKLYNKMLILVTTDKFNVNPSLEFIKNKKNQKVIKEDKWQRIINYELSPNLNYLVMHNRNPYSGKLWDYIYFIDLKTKKDWTYLFPVCLSCKRTKIDLSIDDEGKVEVIHKNEHRIFDKDGNLLNIFIKLD